MKVLHLIDSFSRINYGIWNAALAPAEYSEHTHLVWFKEKEAEYNYNLESLQVKALSELNFSQFSSNDTIVVSHGCWLQPSQLLRKAAKMNYKTVYTPHGMLEPWSMNQKRLKKTVYFHFKERAAANSASCIRAVSRPEADRLSKKFMNNKVVYIPNGSGVSEIHAGFDTQPLKVIFIGRLHHKKGVFPLVKAWSQWNPDPLKWQLLIAGPDEGELNKIKPFVGDSIKYLGPIYQEEKEKQLSSSHFFALPSYSEGFPTSVVEAIGYGLIPLVSVGCNFPEALNDKTGLNFEPDSNQILKKLKLIENLSTSALKSYSHNSIKLSHQFDIRFISKKLDELYQRILRKEGNN